jgi:hypothetical protein
MENPKDLSPFTALLDRFRHPVPRLLLLLTVAAGLRMVGLGSNPPGFFCDESVLATNARSIGLTGRDLSGTLLPLYCHERSFERWNITDITYQPVYLYAAVPLVRA